jgi:hypothetical protein
MNGGFALFSHAALREYESNSAASRDEQTTSLIRIVSVAWVVPRNVSQWPPTIDAIVRSPIRQCQFPEIEEIEMVSNDSARRDDMFTTIQRSDVLINLRRMNGVTLAKTELQTRDRELPQPTRSP